MSQLKRQHFVPRAYLERWAVGGNVQVRRRDGSVFEANPINGAVEAGMYDVPTPEGGKSSAIEVALADVDSAAVTAMRGLDSTERPPVIGSDTRFVLSVFLALQMTRTAESRERAAFPLRVADYAGAQEVTRELVAEFLERVHLRAHPSEREVEGAYAFASYALEDPDSLKPATAIRLMLGSVGDLFSRIATMNWAMESDRKGRLITSDSPVVIWRAPSPRDDYEGVGVANAEEVRFPLDPWKQLVLSHRSHATTTRMNGDRVRACNVDVAAASHQFIVGRPDRRPALEALPLAEHRPVLRFDVGPGFEEGSDGRLTRMEGDILHVWVPRR